MKIEDIEKFFNFYFKKTIKIIGEEGKSCITANLYNFNYDSEDGNFHISAFNRFLGDFSASFTPEEVYKLETVKDIEKPMNEKFKKILMNLKNYIRMLKDDLEGFEDENWDLTNDNKDLENRIEELQGELDDCKNEEND